eukprot:PhF_6_TR20785/c0_g2_i1/m.29841
MKDHSVLHWNSPKGVTTEILEFPSHCVFQKTFPSPHPTPPKILVIIPGNPGNPRFYTPMARLCKRKYGSVLGVVVIGYAGHCGGNLKGHTYGLDEQIETISFVLDEIRERHGKEGIEVSIAGHSVGSFISLEMVKRGHIFKNVFLLTPTIHSMAQSPNGKQRWWLLLPWVRNVLAATVIALTYVLPNRLRL